MKIPQEIICSTYRQISVLILLMVCSVQAQTVHYKIDVVLDGAPNTASYKKGDRFTASISVNHKGVSGSGDEVLTAVNGLESISFYFIGGHEYSIKDDPSNGYPRVFLTDGRFTGIDFWNSKGLVGGGRNSFFRFFKDGSFQYSPEGADEYEGNYTRTSTVVPEPSTSSMTLLALFLLISRRSRALN